MSNDQIGEPLQASLAESSLKPSMHGFGALLITLSCLSPSIGVFIVGSDVIRQAGTGVFICFAAAALVGVAMAMVYGELASAFPQTGGEYTILGKALGPGWGVAVLGLNLMGFSLAQSLSAQGVVTYIDAVVPGLPVLPSSIALVLVVTGIGVLNIRVNAWITGAFLAVELLALVLVAVLGFAEPHRSLGEVVLHPAAPGPGGVIAPASLALLGAATAAGIYAFNGYGSVVFLGEEMHEAPKRIARVVFLALGVAALTELLPVLAVLIGAKNIPALLAAKAPIAAFIAETGGPVLAKVMSAGVALAIFNSMIAVALMGGRQLYSTGRDGFWTERLNTAFATIDPRLGSPWVATLTVGAAALVGCLIDPTVIVILLGNGNVAIYAGLSVAVIVGRKSGATRHTGYRMPLFPLAPVAALLALVAVVWFDLHDADGTKGLIATVVVVLAGVGYHRLVLRRRTGWAYRGPPASV